MLNVCRNAKMPSRMETPRKLRMMLRLYFHVSYDLYDRITNSAFGSLVFTLKTEKEEKARQEQE